MSLVTSKGIRGMDRLRGQLRAYPRFVQDQTQALTRKHARALISSGGVNKGLVQIIPPASLDRSVFGSAAKKQGEAKVMGDIWKVYGTPGDVYAQIKAKDPALAAGYWQAVKRKDWAAANGLARRLGMPQLIDFTRDDGTEHRRRRGADGRVKGKAKTLFVQDARYVRAYIRMRQRNVGMLAAALVRGYSGQYGPLAAVPAWISRHAGSWGAAQITETLQSNKLAVRISLDGKAQNSDLQRFFNMALRFRLVVMEREAPHFLRAAAKSAGLLK